MVEFLKNLIFSIFGNHVWLGIIILSAIPITELRTALPFAMSSVWSVNKLTWWQAYICAVVGSTIPALVIVPLLIPVFNWMKKTKWFSKLATSLDARFSNKSKNINSQANLEVNQEKTNSIKFWGVVTFVAIPLPLTGAWTGSAVAAYLKMHWAKGVLAVFIGNCISGLVMLIICTLFPNSMDIIMYGFLGLAILLITISLIIHFVKKKRNVQVVQGEAGSTQEEVKQ